MAPKRPKTPKPIRMLTGIRLDAAVVAASPADARSWVQIARAGRFRGYRSGAIEFTADYFAQLIRNFRAHPSYVAGPDGYGSEGLVHYDYDHGSEDGDVDQTTGEPAASWVCDLEQRLGANGAVELWALTQFLEPARTYIREGKYKWTSVAIWPNAIDPVTGKDIGPLLTSVAFTNNPFIQGMAPIAIAASMYFSKADSPEDAVTKLREMLGLPQMTELSVVQTEIGKLKGWLDAGAFPPGVDGDDLIGGMRAILGLPVLSTADETFAELAKLVPALADYQRQELAEGAANLPASSAAPTMASRMKAQESAMASPDNRIQLARAYGLKDDASDESILMAAKEGADTKAKLGALLKALGVEDSDGAIGKLSEMLKKCSELEAAMPELAELRAEKAKREGEEQEKDVDDAIAAHALPGAVREALVMLRRSNPEKFASQFPRIKANERHLTTQLFSTPGGAPLGSHETGAGGAKGQRVLASNSGGNRVMLSATAAVTADDLDGAEGRNTTERAITLLKSHSPDASKWSFDQLHEQAARLIRTLRG